MEVATTTKVEEKSIPSTVVGKETVKSLLDKLNFAKKIISSNPVVPILENVLFDKGVMYASDLQNATAQMTDFKGSFVVPFALTHKFLSKISNKKQEVEIEYCPESYSVVFNLAETRFKVAGENHTEFPKITVPKDQIGTISQEDIETIVSLFKYVTKDQLRPSMTGVLITNEEAVATDGHRMAVRKFSKPLGIDCSFIIPPAAAKILPELNGECKIKISNMKKVGDRECESYNNLVEGNVSFVDNEKGVFLRLIGEYYPDFKNVIPNEFPNKITFSKKVLMEAIELAMIAANRVTYQLRMALTKEDTVQISAEDLDFSHEFCKNINATSIGGTTFWWKQYHKEKVDKETGEVLKEAYEEIVKGGSVEIGFSGKLLLEIVKDIEADNISIEMLAANKGVMINGEVLLMPVMLNKYV